MKNFTTQSGDKKLTEIVHQLQAQSKALIRLGNFKAERVRDRSQSFCQGDFLCFRQHSGLKCKN